MCFFDVFADKSAVVSVAQLVERRIVIPVVAGSNPVVHPTHVACPDRASLLCTLTACSYYMP